RLTRERRAFPSSVRSLAARVRRVGIRLAGRLLRRATSARSLARQVTLLRYWLRCSRQVTTTPVGRCLSLTAVSTLFTCCPPGPPERKVSTSHSRSKSSSDSGSVIIRSLPVDVIDDARVIVRQEKGVAPEAEDVGGTPVDPARADEAGDEVFGRRAPFESDGHAGHAVAAPEALPGRAVQGDEK